MNVNRHALKKIGKFYQFAWKTHVWPKNELYGKIVFIKKGTDAS